MSACRRRVQGGLFAGLVASACAPPRDDPFSARPGEARGGASGPSGVNGTGGINGTDGAFGAGGSPTVRDGSVGGSAGSDSGGPRFDGGQPTTPVIPVGFDAYRRWDRLPDVRIGARTYMRSTYDRAGGNESADASHFLRQEATDRNVTLDVAGNGVLYFVRTNHWHGSPWHYGVDGTDFLVQESSTADPTRPVAGSVFLPEAAFPNPLTWTWSVTKGADLNWVPIPFTKSFSLAYGRTHYGTGYYIYQLFPEGADNLSASLAPFAADPPPADVLALLGSAGDDLAPPAAVEETGTVDAAAASVVPLTTLDGPRTVRALSLTVSQDQALAASRARLRITWDDRAAPSVDAPLALFFGAGSLENRTSREWLVKGLLANIRFTGTDVRLATYFPMPFWKSARIELATGAAPLQNVRFSVKTIANDDAPGTTAPFHATYRDHGDPVGGSDLVVLDTKNTEGGGDFCGSFVGMSWIFSDAAVLATLEGDPRFFFDDSASPQAQGTGTEEWGGGGDYWGGENMTLPLAGHPVGAPSPGAALSPEDKIESAYRFLLADAMPFGKNARIQLEHGGDDLSSEHYQSVAYWYGTPGACLELTDTLHVGDAADEAAHAYVSPTASSVDTVTSRYELGVDHVWGIEVYPETTDTGRHMTGTTEFTVSLSPENLGMMLRRKLDYAFPDQRAQIFVADDRRGAPFVRAGTWYLAGSNTCIFSNPPGELDDPTPVVETSNRRFRDDEFLVRRALTEGRSRVRVRIVFDPVNEPLTPGAPVPETAWSELRYAVYSWVLPK